MQRKIYSFLIWMMLLVNVGASAQEIRYVSKNGAYSNDGKSWGTAKYNIQDAINDLVDNGLTGEVWVAAGTYTPTESTESSGGSTLYMSFKIPAGITVRGGFEGTETSKDQRAMNSTKSIGDVYKYATILSGDLSSAADFTWNRTKDQWNTSFYGNCYHVVFFATNGFDASGRAKPNGGGKQSAVLEGCIIEHGNAYNSDIAGRPHNAYGGGVYMVEGSYLLNCMVRQCVAYRDGGGIYMDGGGYVEHTGVTDCQTLGIGTTYGYGGGVCMDGPATYTSSNNPMILRRSGVFGCVARMGGGISIAVNDTLGNNKYKIACTSVVVANNTATTEAGGIYMNRGGAITQMTVVNNKCNGAGVITNGMANGRAASIYCRDNAIIANSVMWGGLCAANNNIQFASSRSGNSNSLNPYMMYSSLTHSDYTDWSGVTKREVAKLSEYNTSADGTANASEGYPMFYNPTPNAGYVSSAQAHQFLYGGTSTIATGVTLYDATGARVDNVADIKPGTTYYLDANQQTVAEEGTHYTYLGDAYDFQPESRSSINHKGVLTADLDRYGETPAFEVDLDVMGRQFTPRPTNGAYTSSTTTIAPQETTDADGKKVYNFYVAPEDDRGTEYASIGSSWDQPVRFLADALNFIKTQNYDETATVNVYVKQGTVNNTTTSVTGRIRTISINVPSNVHLYGGYASENTGTSLDVRNPNTYVTTISAEAQGIYDLNVAHLLNFDGTKKTLLDGFSIRRANARSTEMIEGTPVTTGAAMTFTNASEVVIRNCGVANNTATQGAVANLVSSEVHFENCIFHNNESRELNADGTVKSTTGNILVGTGSQAVFSHCDFIRNVGFAIDTYGKVTTVNSMFYGNMSEPLEDTRNNADKALVAVRLYDKGTFEGDHNLYDAASKTFISNNNLDATNEAILDYKFSDTSTTYPRFLNPTRNAGVSTSGDVTYYGRTISFQPHNNNPMVNRASTVDYQGNTTTDHTKWGKDMTGIITRDYGGLPDIGALENHEGTVADEGEKAYPNGQRPYGGALYVRDYRDSNGKIDTSIDGRDGSSWGNAINGNGTYTSTTVTGGTPTTPVASTIKNPVTYKIGMLSSNTAGNSVYYAKNHGGTYMNGTTDYSGGDDFIIIDAGSGYYYIYNVTQSKYAVYTDTGTGANKVYLSSTITSNATWRLKSQNTAENYHTYCIQPSSVTTDGNYTPSWNYVSGAAGGNNVGFWYASDDNSKWQFMIPKTVKGFQYAINQGNAQWQEDKTSLREVRVGAGTYYANLEWLEGVNVRGGYPAKGNPGEHERNISNSKSDYMTIIDANGSGRVLLQPSDFSTQATFEGFTIQNGYLTGSNYGAGVYLRSNGILKNCLVQSNVFDANSSTEGGYGGAGVFLNSGSIVKNCKIMKNTINGNGVSKFVGGAGVYAAGGTLINSLIVENTTSNSNYNILGSGFYIGKISSIYNCTIAYNIANETGNYPATGGVWDASGNSAFYNSIIWGNYATGSTPENMVQVGISGYSSGGGVNKNLYTCYSSAWSKKYSSDDVSDANKVLVVGTGSDGTRSDYQTFYNNCKSNEPFVRDANDNTDYSLKATATQCINKGSEFDALDTYDITVDINGEDRIQDCTIDKGAYEYNQSLDITPEKFTTTTGTTSTTKAVFYVTPEGHGTASADSPANAACASKLQKVLDAAGRYKYLNPKDTVIVKVANSKTLQEKGEKFQYYACRTTDEMDQSVRVWSIIVPRGVEVWGGYTDTYTSATDNGFYTKDTSKGTITDNRDITGNPTYFDSYYYNKYEKQNANTYHVVTFTDRVFDGEGNPYVKGNTVGDPSSWTEGNTDYLSMKEQVGDRAVIDGLYITGGNADAQVTNLANTNVNINQYGGAAIVTDYAHVRNCIVQGNSATYGGALALTHNALVSGCLIDQNTADYGGAIYMFENGTKLSDGTLIDTTPSGKVLDEKMAHVYTSTIVNNTANSQGGGIWFGQDEENINIRVNSTVVWQNSSSSQANISGLFNPTKVTGNTATTMQFYPFSYCAVQNLRLSGVNNIQLANLNSAGVRFADKSNAATDQQTLAKETTATDFTRFSNFGYYGLTNYSVLVRTGMPVTEYTALVKSAGLSAADFMAKDRLVATSKNRSYIEIGARALDKIHNNGQLMLRLFVAKSEDVDMDAAQTMMNLATTAKKGSVEEYYSQEGSSFAYPMQNLQDAIDYIIEKRSYKDTLNTDQGLNEPGANNLPFEIFIAKGTYYPTRNLAGVYGNSPGNSFLLPEGVSVYGSFAVGNPSDAKSFIGRYYEPNSDPDNYENVISKNVTALTDEEVTIGGTYKMEQKPISNLYTRRRTNDNNGNNIIEPWEFANQTILSGDVENSQHNGVYHVVQAVADQNVVGMLPKPSESHEEASTVYLSPSYADYTKKMGKGSFDFEEGQYIILDGVQITGGQAMNYIEGSTTYMSKYNYYSGGAILVDGNRYCDDYNKKTNEGLQYKHAGIVGAVGYRDIPLIVAHCKLIDNTAGLGGALCSNGTVNLYMDAFEQNRAQSGTDKVKDSKGNTVDVNYAGIGGAVAATHQFSAYNTLFANNEAYDKALSVEGKKFTNLSVHDDNNTEMIGGVGGVAYMGPYAYFHIVNCDLVRNQANLYPAVYTRNPNKDYTGTRNDGIGSGNDFHPSTVYYNQFVNTVIWGNDINDEMSRKYDSDSKYPLFKFNSRLICNYAPGEYDSYGVPDFTSSSTNSPADQEALDKGSNEAETAFGETAWFCAYEEGRGVTPLNNADFRASEYNPFHYVRDIVHGAGMAFTPAVNTYQNCNIQLSADNLELEGPNFINPSTTPGYAGYNESADWSPARLNNLVDNGSGQISQTITLENEVYKCSFDKYENESDLPNHSIYNNSVNPDGYTTENVGDYKTEGAYTTTRVLYGYNHHRLYMPEGELPYMTSAATGQQLYRISYDPNPTHNQTYIDIGVYEYPHTELSYTTDGDEVDILWVSSKEKPDNGLPDGSAWSQPTSDLQRAIETLLASRNGHRKEIRLMQGSYTPIYTFNDKLAFTIDTKTLNQSVVLPVQSTSDGKTEYVTGKGVVSLTIKGGYSENLNNVYNPKEYPAIMRQQVRTNETSNRWDHLFYIYDPTQRYGYTEYSETNGDGHYAPTTDGSDYNRTVNTIPIHIDGVTLVNNQAMPDKNGAAIYYEDMDASVTSPTAAHVSVNQYYSDADTTQVSTDNEPTLHFNRQVDKYYTDATYTTESETPTAYVKYKYVDNANNKIIISKSKIMNSGSWTYDRDNNYTTSAVYIGKNGGNALLYNDVMHSNWGNPLVSAVNTTVVNNTYALNKGYVNLNGNTDRSAAVTSSIFNSVFWRNNATTTGYGKQFDMLGYVDASESGSMFSHNALTGFDTSITDYSLDDIPNNNYNVGLSDVNTDVINGPNFTSPNVGATTSEDIEKRDFTLQPSLRLLNKGSDDLYQDNLTKYPNAYNIYDLAWVTTLRMDAAGLQRFCYDIDLGAYEYQNNLNRIIYVNPNVGVSGLGNKWADPVAYGNLQAAIDLASVYHVNNTGEEAYVFVKGAGSNNTGLHLGETITMRNGVSIYGSILPTRTEDCPYSEHEENGSTVRTYKQEDIDAYISTLVAERSGVASPAANRTTIGGIKVPASTTFDNTNKGIVSLVDGFDVTAKNSSNPTGAVTEPVIDVEPLNADGHVALRNLIVHDNDASGTAGVNIANVNNALIYEALFRDNKVSTTGSQLHIMQNGYGVNLTVEGTTVGADGKSTYNGAGDADHIYYSLVNYAGQAATENTLSGYNYKVSDQNLNYQLTEQSKHIDQCAATNPIASVASLAQFINYDTDRDLLGNLRLLKGVSSENKIDRGAFETWRVEQDVETTSKDKDGANTNYYPHQGSVVYLMKGNSLVLEEYAATTDANGVVTATSGTALRPAYLLVQDGASLYGNGNTVAAGYVGLERTVSNQGAMVSVPYAMQYKGTEAATNGVGIPSYNATTGVLSLTTATDATAYTYNGVGRSAWNSAFYDTQSAYWTSLSNEATDANTGVLYKPSATGTYRFTAQGDADDMSKYVYTETIGETAKNVTLKQYDDRTSTNGAADFTEKEDMGWNCIGLPWLVSDYNPAAKEDFTGDNHYNMDIPHTLWLWYDGKTYPDGNTAADGDGGYYSVSSWDTTDWHLATDEQARIWAGEGFFTQTAAVSDTESLQFYRPVYTKTGSTGAYAIDGDEVIEVKKTAARNARYYVTDRGIDTQTQLNIHVRGRVIYVTGLQGGENITVFDTQGRIYNMEKATGEQYSTAVPTSGVYIIRVDNATVKVAVK